MVSKPTCSAPRVHRRESDKLIGVQRCSSVIPVHLTGEHPRRCGHNRDTMTAENSEISSNQRISRTSPERRHCNENAINETNGNQQSDLSKEQGVTQSLPLPERDPAARDTPSVSPSQAANPSNISVTVTVRISQNHWFQQRTPTQKRLDSNDIQPIQSSRFLRNNPLMVQDDVETDYPTFHRFRRLMR